VVLPVGRASLRAGLLWLAAGTFVAFAALSAVGTLAVHAALSRVEREDVAKGVIRARQWIARQVEVRVQTVREYAWKSDTWDYLDHPHAEASRRFVQDNFVAWLPRQYGDAFIGIWALDRSRVFIWADSGGQGLETLFERPGQFDVVARVKSMSGFVSTPRGLFLAAVSVVVRSDDPVAAGPWHGYVAFARPVSDALLREWSVALQARLTLVPASLDLTAEADTASSRLVAGGDSVETRFAVRGVYGQVVALAVLTTSREFLGGVRRWTLGVTLAAAAAGLTVIALLWLVGVRTLVRPLESIAVALGRMRAQGRLSTLGAPAKGREWSVFVGAFNEAAEALGASEERYRTLFQQTADALFVLRGSDRTIEDANPAAERVAGCGRDALVGRPLSEFLAAPAGGAGPADTVRWRREDGSIVPVEVLTGNVEFAAHRLTLVSVRDLTERLALEEQLRQSQKMEVLGRLAGGIAHDFNNLLGAVLVSANSLQEEIEPRHPAQTSVQTIERVARRAAELTRQLLSFARREGVRREPVAVRDLIAGVRQICQRTFGPAVRLAVESGAPDDLAVLGDAGQLEQVLLNLSINARDAMPDGGTLTLRAAVVDVDETDARRISGLRPGRYAVLSVADTGIGIPADVRPHLFEPFFTTKERGKGTGLGLATTFGIVQSHGGAIDVHSEVGLGSRFDIYLPLAAPAASVPRPRAGPATGGSETILLVDDEDDLRRVLARALAALGYTVIQARTGVEAVARFAERPDDIQLVMLDVLMPEMGGVRAFNAIRACRPTARVLAMSGHASGEEMQQLVGGVEGVLEKPFEFAVLASTLRGIFDRATPPSPGA
jgi:PAS domain S-box-containing protein